MKICTHLLITCGLSPSPLERPRLNTHTYSKAVQKACANDYHKHCGQYGIETEALRLCMDKAGHGLSKTCVDALHAGEVSKQEVERRKKRAANIDGFG